MLVWHVMIAANLVPAQARAIRHGGSIISRSWLSGVTVLGNPAIMAAIVATYYTLQILTDRAGPAVNGCPAAVG